MAFSGLGSGTEADPYQITTVVQLQEAKDYLTSSFILMNDIDASDTETWNISGSTYLGFEPIGQYVITGSIDTPFLGSFDGGGYKISNLYINRTTASHMPGLFGFIRGSGSEEKVVNGTFTGSAANWTVGSGWVWTDAANDYMQINPTVGIGTLSQNCSVEAGGKYILIYTTSTYVAGSITPTCGGTALSTRSSAATFTEQFTATTTGSLIFTPTDTANMRLDTVSLIRVLTFKDVELVDIDITGNYAGGFSGAVYGKNATNLYTVFDNIKVSGRVTAVNNPGGMFGETNSGVSVTDCESNCYVENSAGFIGGFAGRIQGGTFTDCKSSGVVSVTGTLSEAGGFVGYVTGNNTTFSGCRSDASILSDTSSASAYMGGFVGLDDQSSTYTLCGATGGIIYTHTASAQIGGFVGSGPAFSKCYAKGNIYAANCTGTLGAGGFAYALSSATDCYAWGDVCSTGIATGTAAKVGGFTALLNSDTATDCYSTGFVTSDAGVHGGFIGERTASTCTTCYWDTESSGQSSAVGTGVSTGISGLTTANAILQASYTGFDFTSTWVEGTSVSPAIAASNLTVWLSASGDYEKFDAGTKDGDSFQLTIPSTNEIRWIESMDSLVIGTAGDEWKIGSNKLGTPLSPTNFGVKRQTNYGSARMQAIRVNEVILFADYVKRKVREMSYDSSADKFTCPDMTSLAEHITQGQIKWMAYQRNPDSMLWVGLITGDVKVFVYDREQNVLAWTNFPIENASVQSGCVIPGETEDIVYLAVDRTVAGDILYYEGEVLTWEGETLVDSLGDRTYIEKVAPRLFTTKADAFYVDCGMTYEYPGSFDITGGQTLTWEGEDLYYENQLLVDATWGTVSTTSTATGYDHLDGETVQVLADGVHIDDAVVYDGNIDLTLAGTVYPATKVQAGLPYTSTVQPMRLVMGDSIGKNTKVNQLVISFVNTGKASYGKSMEELFEIDFSDARWVNSCEIEGLFSGEVTVETAGGFDSLTSIYIISNSPTPCTVRAIIVDIDRTG